MAVLMANKSGRGLLIRSGTLANLLPTLEQRALAAADNATELLQTTAASGTQQAALVACRESLEAAVLYARSAIHMHKASPCDGSIAPIAAVQSCNAGSSASTEDMLSDQQQPSASGNTGCTTTMLEQIVSRAGAMVLAAADWTAGSNPGEQRLQGFLAAGAEWCGLLCDMLSLLVFGRMPSDNTIKCVAGCGWALLQVLLAAQPCTMEGAAAGETLRRHMYDICLSLSLGMACK